MEQQNRIFVDTFTVAKKDGIGVAVIAHYVPGGVELSGPHISKTTCESRGVDNVKAQIAKLFDVPPEHVIANRSRGHSKN